MGLPTTEEEAQQKLMEEIMAKQGAQNPMAGLPYDPKLYGQKPGNSGPTIPFAHQWAKRTKKLTATFEV